MNPSADTRYRDSQMGRFHLHKSLDSTEFRSHDNLLDRLVAGEAKCYQGKSGFSSIVKLTSKSFEESRPFAVVWRRESMPIVLSMPPTIVSDNVFNVEVLVVSPATGFDISLKIMKAKIEGDMEIQPEGFGHQHYLLNEITLRASLALCYESLKYDNEEVRILCCVEDDIDYTTDIDTTLYPTEHRPVKYSGALYHPEHDNPLPRTTEPFCDTDVPDYDSRFFPQEFAELDEFADGYLPPEEPVIEKVEPYLDTRAPIAWGKSDYWVEMIRCDKCGQRVILGLTKAQCPEGQPDVSFACKACKTTIKHL